MTAGNEFKGSRLHCLQLTGLPSPQVARELTALAKPSGARITEVDCWMPRGLESPSESKLGEQSELLSEPIKNELTRWWLAVPKGANTPNWDIASTCKFGDRRGLMLIEAKAYAGECSRAGKREPMTPHGWENHEKISGAIGKADTALNGKLAGWILSRDQSYQLSNRFAWAWKLASLGVPVVLVYLGFLNDKQMPSPFTSAAKWDACVSDYAKEIVPEAIWGRSLDINGTPLWALRRTFNVDSITRGDS